MTMSLTDRYIDAVTRSLPEAQRADVAAELRASVADQIDDRTASGADPDAAEREVLTGLGDPDALAAGYADRPLQLIGPRYYLDWLRLVKLLLWIVPACAAFGVALGQVLSGAAPGTVIGTTIAVTLSVIVHVVFWTTLVFAIVERHAGGAAQPLTTWTLDRLPEPRAGGTTFADMVVVILMLLVGAGAVLWDHSFGFVPGMRLSVLAEGLWPWWITGLFVAMALEAVLTVVDFVRGRWTVSLAVANAVLTLAVAVPALWLLMTGQLLNPEFFPTLITDGEGPKVQQIFEVITGFVIAGIAVWDIIDGFRKVRR
ncbi:permease prefix domain 1-containing protein [Microbacterium sp. MC2]